MFINKTIDGRNNICGKKISSLRISMNISQRKLADRLQVAGLDIDKNAIQRIECGKRFVTDIELIVFANVLECSLYELLDQ
ncbi:MAG: helix-turn-helix transcriptional regulator [Lachnospiraceae bacterium]|nr:helix-turn-helix transcriptional regulator [Lachnospiraceae bacterium]